MGWSLDVAVVFWAEQIIRRVIARDPRIVEGSVRSPCPVYRRLNCGRPALAYIRPRPTKGLVRVEVTGVWRAPDVCTLEVPGSIGRTLEIRHRKEIDVAVEFILSAVARTLDGVHVAEPMDEAETES